MSFMEKDSAKILMLSVMKKKVKKNLLEVINNIKESRFVENIRWC
jgi:hypothetical protein